MKRFLSEHNLQSQGPLLVEQGQQQRPSRGGIHVNLCNQKYDIQE